MSKILPWLAFGLSLILAWSVFRMARDQKPLTARQILEQTERKLEDGEITRQDAIRELDRAIELAREKTRPNLLADLYTARGHVYFGMNGLTKASEDFERVIDIYRPGDRQVENALVDVDIAAGNHESAQARLQGILRTYPEDPYAWTRSGKLGMLAGEALVEECREWIRDALVPEEAEEASELVGWIAARHPRDPSRVALIRELRLLFPDDDGELVRRILDTADEASQSYRQARTATATALKYEVSDEAATQLMHLFAAAGRHEEVVDLGQQLLQAETSNPVGRPLSEETSLVLLKSLRALERYQPAARVVKPWMRRSMTIHTADFYRTACQALYESESWVDLVPLAGMMRMRGFDKDTTRFANLYQGVGLVERGGMDELAIYALSRFFAGLDHEIFPGSRTIGFLAKARAQRALGEPAELESLLGVVSLDPDCDGEVHLRIADLMRNSPNRGPLPPLVHLTHAMRKLPERTEELLPLWIELGEKEISTSSVNMDSIFARLKENKQWAQNRGATPYRQWRFGEMYRAEGEWVGLNAVAKRNLSGYPNFLPSIDHRIEAELELSNELAATDLILHRIDLAGLDDKAREWMARVPELGSSGERIVRLMRADPGNTGRLVLARAVARKDGAEAALEFLRGIEGEPTDDQLVLVTELQLELGRRKAAESTIALLEERGADEERVADLRVRSILVGGDVDELERLATEFLAGEDTGRAPLIDMADRLVARDLNDLALEVLSAMDSRPELRGGDVLMRLVRLHMLEGRFEEAAPFIERAEAFDAEGGPELAQIFLDLEDRRWTELPRHVTALRRSAYRESDVAAVILDLFAEDLEGARARVDEVRESFVLGEAWEVLDAACRVFETEEIVQAPFLGTQRTRDLERLVLGSVEVRRDPRETLGLLLALESPGWLPWARKKISELDHAVVGPLWPNMFLARAEVLDGNHQEAENNLDAVHSLRPDFGPAWVLHEQLRAARVGSAEHPEVLRLRLQRAEAMGQSASNVKDLALTEVLAAFAAQDWAKTEELALQLVADHPRWPLGHAKLGELYAKTHRHKLAVEAFAQACLTSGSAPDLPYVPRLLASLPLTDRGRDRLSSEEVSTLLEELGRHLPNDPLLALELAKKDIEDEPIDPTIGVDRAFARLERFVAETRRSLEELRPRSTRKWVDFYLEIDPERADRFLEAELVRRPGELELWILRSRVLRARGDLAAAIENCETMLTMAHDSRILRELCRLRAATGSDIDEVDQLVARITELEGIKGLDGELILVKVQGLLNTGSIVQPQTLNLLSHLWTNRRGNEDLIRPGELARIYVNALLRRGQRQDHLQAQTVIDTLLGERLANWYEIPYFNAMLGVAGDLPEEEVVEARPPAERQEAAARNASAPR